MNFYFLKWKFIGLWRDNKPFFIFITFQILFLSIIKLIFYYYNYSILFSEEDTSIDTGKIKMIGWSLFYDSIIVLGINFWFLLLLHSIKFLKSKTLMLTTTLFFFVLNTFIAIINIVDVFYYKFHLQRLNADIRFVFANSFHLYFKQPYYIIIPLLILFFIITFLYFKFHIIFYLGFYSGNKASLTAVILTSLFLITLLEKETSVKKLIPTYPLLNISNKQLPAVQNSFHTLIYSFFREQHYIPAKKYFSGKECDSIFSIRKNTNSGYNGIKKNVVLFIMESVAYDFFDSTNEYKVKMPFFDSLIQKSYFYNNAYSFGLESNKGIVSILAGQPTLTDIPLYHSPFTGMPLTRIGNKLADNGYNSFFCIGDQYDNFGFAKCINWLGINKYYCQNDIVVDKDKPMHSLGMQDEYVLNFFNKKISQTKEPFLAIHYNISTHYPYDIPIDYNPILPKNYTPAMKSMSYYDHCLNLFFSTSSNEKWFKNTIFIFCSDHWMYPNENIKNFNTRNSFRIPIIIYDPLNKTKKVETKIASQFDILGTILNITQNRERYISYGNDLLSTDSNSNFVITKMNNNLYQIIDSTFILGYNVRSDTVEYMFKYLNDKSLKNNLINSKNFIDRQKKLIKKIKSFFQQITMQYNNKLLK